MPITIIDFPADPECDGIQWTVDDIDELAMLTALVLIGRSQHVAKILTGTHRRGVAISPALKDRLRAQLFPGAGAAIWHRDGLLFEIICWIVACMTAEPNEVISDPHLQSTEQGVDTLKLTFDPTSRVIARAIICEQKCSNHARAKFRKEVLPAFRAWFRGDRDNQLAQAAGGLLRGFALTHEEHVAAVDRLIQVRPLVFQAALTVKPSTFEKKKCVSLFKGFKDVTPTLQHRLGHTFPLAEIRPWFAAFAAKVWQQIEALNV
jgi:hypothetical protein